MKSNFFALLSVCSISMVGCAVGQKRFDEMVAEKVKRSAAFDLGCDAASLKVSKIDNRVFGTQGCGKKARYIVTGPGTCSPEVRLESLVESDCVVVRK